MFWKTWKHRQMGLPKGQLKNYYTVMCSAISNKQNYCTYCAVVYMRALHALLHCAYRHCFLGSVFSFFKFVVIDFNDGSNNNKCTAVGLALDFALWNATLTTWTTTTKMPHTHLLTDCVGCIGTVVLECWCILVDNANVKTSPLQQLLQHNSAISGKCDVQVLQVTKQCSLKNPLKTSILLLCEKEQCLLAKRHWWKLVLMQDFKFCPLVLVYHHCFHRLVWSSLWWNKTKNPQTFRA